MRIGLVSNLSGGLKQFVENLCEGLADRGFQVEVLCPASPTLGRIRDLRLRATVHAGPSAFGRLFTTRYDLIHYNIAALGVLAILRRKLNRTPLVQTFHGIPQWWTEPLVLDKALYAMEHNAIRMTAKSIGPRISVSHFVKCSIRERFGIDSAVVHNGVRHCLRQNSWREAFRRKLGICDAVAVLFVGRLHPYKDPMTLLRAVARLTSDRRRIKLLVVGHGPLSEVFRKKVVDLGLQNAVTWWSHVSQQVLHSIYSASDIFCLPSINEAFGLVVLEAMDHSIPSVVSKSGALPEVVGDAGLTFQAGDEIDLSRTLLHLVDDPDLRQRLGRLGRARLESHFSAKSMVEQYVRIYERGSTNHATRAY